jgi:isopentenyl-diphosphate delta-isomerase
MRAGNVLYNATDMSNLQEEVILIDHNDQPIGTMEKMEAHVQGKLHRAFSVFVFNTTGELLLQQRAFEKYHSGGKWTNTCCSHPRMGEENLSAAYRRLAEEMGMTCILHPVFNFTYHANIQQGIIEHEYDHVFFGVTNTLPVPAPEEVAATKYLSIEALAQDLQANPDNYTEWLRICFSKVMHYYSKLFTNVPASE